MKNYLIVKQLALSILNIGRAEADITTPLLTKWIVPVSNYHTYDLAALAHPICKNRWEEKLANWQIKKLAQNDKFEAFFLTT